MTAVVAVLVGIPATALAASGEPDNTQSLVVGNSAFGDRPSLVAPVGDDVLVQFDRPDFRQDGRLVSPDGTITQPSCLQDMSARYASGSMVVGFTQASDGTTQTTYCDTATGQSGLAQRGYQSVVAATPDGWVEARSNELYRVVASTREETPLGSVPGKPSSVYYQIVTDEDGMALDWGTGSAVWYMPWAEPGMFRQVPGSGFRDQPRFHDLNGSTVLWTELVNGKPVLVRSQLDGTRVQYAADASSAALTSRTTVWTDGSRLLSAPAQGGTARQLSDVGNSWPVSVVAAGDNVFYNNSTGNLDTSGVFVLEAGSTSPTRVLVPPPAPLSATHVALGGGRAIWIDNQRADGALWSRPVGRSGDTFSLGPTTFHSTSPGESIAVSAGRILFTDSESGRLAVSRIGSESRVLSPAGGNRPALSGHRVVTTGGTNTAIWDLRTDSVTYPKAGPSPALWGDRLAYLRNDDMTVHLRDLATGSDLTLGSTVGLSKENPEVAVWGDTVAWQESRSVQVVNIRSGERWSQSIDSRTRDIALSGSHLATVTTAFGGQAGSVDVYDLRTHEVVATASPTLGSYQPDEIALDDSRLGWIDESGAPKITALPYVPEAPRHLGSPLAPATHSFASGAWSAEWVFTKPLTECAVVISAGTTEIRSLPCSGEDASVRLSWDGRLADGRPAAAGDYTWTLTGRGADGPLVDVDGSVKALQGGITVTRGPVDRWYGNDRFATSAKASANTFAPGVDVAFVASGLNFPDALSGAPIAGLKGGPVLLTNTTSLPSVIATELARLKPKKIVILGSSGAVNDSVKTKLDAYTTGPVDRWYGNDRFATSAKASANTFTPGVDVAFIASGLNFPDALSGAPIAGLKGGPVLLTNTTSVPSVITKELTRLKPRRIVILGSSGAVSDSVKSQLAKYVY